jgi:hypothetical protein
VLCTSLLPIKGKASLVQGKDDVSDPMRLPPPHVESVMQSMAARLWLAKSRNSGEEVFGPFDMEIHEVDASLYMVDAARLFPPEHRNGIDPGPRQYYRLLRPELLRKAGMEKGLLTIPDALRYPDEKARRDLAELSNMLDVEIAGLARELTQGQHLDQLSSRHAVKALLHGRGINMRHLPEVVAQLELGSSARSQLQFVLNWKWRLDEMTTKSLVHPRQLTRKELESVLHLQEEVLKDRNQMPLVSTLLQLSDVVDDTIPLEKSKISGLTIDIFCPSGEHPLVRAWEICEKSDVEFVKRSVTSIAACSNQTLLVMCEILRRNRTLDYPREHDLEVLSRREHTAISARIHRYVSCSYFIVLSWV